MPLTTRNVIQQPEAFDLVGDTLMIAGIGTGFEGTLNWRVHDGHDERTGFVNAGDGVGGHGQFQVKVDLTGAAFQLDRIFVEVFEENQDDQAPEPELHKVIVPVIYGPLVMAGYTTFFRHVVARGETLTKIAIHYYGDAQFLPRITRSNPAISNPNLIFPGQELRVPVSAG